AATVAAGPCLSTVGTPVGSMTNTTPGPLRQFALKHEDVFLIADELGDVGGARDGLFSNDTRVLSQLQLTIGDRSPSLLGSGVHQENVFFTDHVTKTTVPRCV